MGFERCPFCQTHQAQRVRFTPWGGVIGPLVLSLVKCGGCGAHFNGRSGRCVKRAIRLYTLAALLVLVTLMALVLYQFTGSRKSSSGMAAPRGLATLVTPAATDASAWAVNW